jgi:putative SOS response-associated peptidase YedK
MCGAFSLYHPIHVLTDRFTVSGGSGSFTPRYNARPAQVLPVILNAAPKQLSPAVWGWHVEWDGKRHQVINTKKESLEKSYTRDAFIKRRCLIPADGFYEWRAGAGVKQPFRFQLKTKQVFAFAGLWQEETDTQGRTLPHFTIITVEPNAIVAKVHDRMPAILKPADERRWIDSTLPATLAYDLLRPYPANLLRAYPVSTAVNSPKNDSPAVIKLAHK